MKKYSYLVPVIILGIFIACKKNRTAEPVTAAGSSAANIADDYIPDQNKYKTVSQCPVTKDKVTVDKTTKAAKYKDNVYYFCCPSCVSTFKSDPEKYIK